MSGSGYVVFGWALTPQPGAIPTNGSTIWLFVDGTPIGHPVYDQYRSDIATLFPGYANSDGAVGYSVLDTTALANGIHTIAWSVTDSLGRADGTRQPLLLGPELSGRRVPFSPRATGRRARAAAWLAVAALAALAAPAESGGVVGDGSPASCTEAALDTALAGGGTVTFHCGGPVVIPVTAVKTLTTTTTVDGTGQQVTLDGGGTTRLFETTYQFASFTITLRNLTLRNAARPTSGGPSASCTRTTSRP